MTSLHSEIETKIKEDFLPKKRCLFSFQTIWSEVSYQFFLSFFRPDHFLVSFDFKPVKNEISN